MTGTAEVTELFTSAGVPGRLAAQAVSRLGAGAADMLRDDPWRLLEIPGIRPEQADHFARGVLGEEATPQDPRRGAAIATHLLLEAAAAGHTALPGTDAVSALTALNVGDPVRAVRAAIEDGRLVAVFDESPHAAPGAEGQESLALPRFAAAEETIAEGVARLMALAEPLETEPETEPALTNARGYGVSVVLAPPAAGARIVTELAGGEPPAVVADRPVTGPFEAELVVVPEANALGAEQLAAVLDACDDGTHLVLVGDPAGLPSAGPGQVLTDLVASKAVPVTELAGSGDDPLGALTTAVRQGSLINVAAPGREVVIVPAGTDAEAAHRAVQLVTDSIPRALGIPVEQVQVVTAGNDGAAGARALNEALKARLNPGQGPLDTGDRVVSADGFAIITGTVTAVGPDTVEVDFAGTGPRAVPAGTLRHGWAVTAQRASTTRWPAVVAVFGTEQAAALSRPLVYTAFTRADRHLSVVHAAGGALATAVRDRTAPERRTRLAGLVAEAVAEIGD